ncbi:MAG: phosphate/phosphite/phosphonate ABC transporter substrate-binding protein [Gammaproteobacteria bacterium]|nr:phosphate/phosphite/phosphonate ABC transporter substrate-binding protein [Gammaproteobacteria bacterium]
MRLLTALMNTNLARLTLAFLLLFPVAASADTTTGGKNELLFGSVAMDIPAIMHKRLRPLTHYLTDRLGIPVSLKLSPNMGAAIKDVATRQVDLTYLTPVAYLKAHAQGGARIVAKTVTAGKASFQLMIVVKEDSPYQSVADLKGKSFAFGDEKALLQRAVVVGAGIEMKDFSEYKFIGHYDNIARAVVNGDFEAGILKDTMAFAWQGKGLRILAESPDLPPYNITASGDIDEAMLAKLKAAFLELDKNNPEHLEVIKAIDKKYDGFAATSDADYDVVRTLIKPFNK